MGGGGERVRLKASQAKLVTTRRSLYNLLIIRYNECKTTFMFTTYNESTVVGAILKAESKICIYIHYHKSFPLKRS